MAQPHNIGRAFAAFARFFKAMPDGEIDRVIEDSLDQWSDMPARQPSAQPGTPSARRLGLGPEEAMSGAGATQMTRDYSDPAPQIGIAGQYGDIGRLLDEVKASILRHLDDSLPADRQRGSATDDDGSYVGKACAALRKARAAAKKADLADDEDAKGTSVAEAKKLLDEARKLLEKAADDEDEGDSASFEKATRDLKRLRERLQEIQATAKADELATPRLTVPEFISAIKSKANTSVMPPDMSASYLAKSDVGTGIARRIEDAEENGLLTTEQAIVAHSFLQQFNSARAGKTSMDQFMARVTADAPAPIREIFGVQSVPAGLTLPHTR